MAFRKWPCAGDNIIALLHVEIMFSKAFSTGNILALIGGKDIITVNSWNPSISFDNCLQQFSVYWCFNFLVHMFKVEERTASTDDVIPLQSALSLVVISIRSSLSILLVILVLRTNFKLQRHSR